MDTKQMKVAAEEIKKFSAMFGNVIALGSEIENVIALEDRAATASRTLADAEKQYEGILAHVNIDEASAAAEKRIADLKAQEQTANSAKDQAQTSLAAVKQELGTVTAELAASKKMIAEIKSEIARIRGAVA